MSNFDYEISNLSGNLNNNMKLLAECIMRSAIQEAMTIIMGNISANIKTNNIDTKNIGTDNISSETLFADIIRSDFAIVKNINLQEQEKFIELILNDKGIFSPIIDNKNAIVMLETIKNILIESGYTTKEKFDDEYNKVEQKIDDIINGEKIARKLMGNSKKGEI